MQFNGTPILDRPAAGVETAPYPLDYSEITTALYASDAPTGTRLEDLSAPVGTVAARLGLAEVATRAKRLQRADRRAYDGYARAYDGYDVARLKWARLNAFVSLSVKPTEAVPLAFYDDVAALWGWRPSRMADPARDPRRAAATIRAEVPADAIKAARARGLALAARAETLDDARSLEALRRWATLRSELACGHPLLSAATDGIAR